MTKPTLIHQQWSLIHYTHSFLSGLFDLGNSLVQGDVSNGTYYLVLATLQVHGDNIKEALVATDSYPNMEL